MSTQDIDAALEENQMNEVWQHQPLAVRSGEPTAADEEFPVTLPHVPDEFSDDDDLAGAWMVLL